MSDPEKPLTQAEKQIRRLETLRLKQEEAARMPAKDAFQPPQTAVERTINNLQALKKRMQPPAKAKTRVKIEGWQKSVKLSHVQLRVLTKLVNEDNRLNGSRVIRIALDRLLGLDQSAEETELEGLIREISKRLKNHP